MDSAALGHDFNNFWGSILGVTELHERPIASALMRQYWEDPAGAIRNFGKTLAQYTDMFECFFGGTLPISFHGHVTDAMSPVTAIGMLMRLAIFSKCDTAESIHAPSSMSRTELASLLGFTEIHLESPRWAVVEGAYAAGFGSVANLSAHTPFRDHATGSLGLPLPLSDLFKPGLSTLLAEAKHQGCIGVVVEIVSNQSNGRVTTPSELRSVSEACRSNGLILAIDETITAIRCGAPFAHQRQEYHEIKPDLVFFGKALGAQGIAINFDGGYMRRLGIEKDSRKKQAVCDWQAVVTKAVQLPVLIDAAGVLEMAKVGDWVGRSRVIGDLLREVVRERVRSMRGGGDEESEIEVIGGLDSFIFMHKKVAVTFLVMGALGAGSKVSWVRWLPRLDRQLMERSTVEALLGSGSLKKRKGDSELLVKKGVRPQWCFYCGTWARGTEYPWCKTCCVDSCDAVECIHQLLSHKCLG